MSLRGRIAAVASVAVALAVLGAALGIYLAVGSELRGQIDHSLREREKAAVPRAHAGPSSGPGPQGGAGGPGGGPGGVAGGVAGGQPLFGPGPNVPPNGAPQGSGPLGKGGGLPKQVSRVPFGGAPGYVQFLSPTGKVTVPGGQGGSRAQIKPDASDKQIAERGRGEAFSDRTVKGVALRVLTAGLGPNGALIVARPLTEVNDELSEILLILVIVGASGIALAALLGTLVARTALAPIVRFTRSTEQLTDSLDASQRLEVNGRDELARLAASFNATLAALERSVETQRQLITDASHELRTPMAALRANIQVLEEAHRLAPADQESLRRDIVQELDELTALVADVVELARGAREKQSPGEPVELEEIVGEAVERARRRGSLDLRANLEPAIVRGDPDRIGRAVTNLLENARKWSAPDGIVEVGLHDGVITVQDHGPGFNEADLPHVFERFYRAANARGLPGSGLGLAIVRQTAEAHGGYVRASNAPDGGAVVEVSFGSPLPGTATPTDSSTASERRSALPAKSPTAAEQGSAAPTESPTSAEQGSAAPTESPSATVLSSASPTQSIDL